MKSSSPYRYLVRDLQQSESLISLPKPSLGPKHVFQKLPQISFEEIDDFDDMTGIDEMLTQRRHLAQEEVAIKEKSVPKKVADSKPSKGEASKQTKEPTKAAPKIENKPEMRPVSYSNRKALEQPRQLAGNRMVKMEELKRHCTRDDAWTAIHGEVYEITEFIKRHPGGQSSVMKIMGQDGTRLFGRRGLTRQSSQDR